MFMFYLMKMIIKNSWEKHVYEEIQGEAASWWRKIKQSDKSNKTVIDTLQWESEQVKNERFVSL